MSIHLYLERRICELSGDPHFSSQGVSFSVMVGLRPSGSDQHVDIRIRHVAKEIIDKLAAEIRNAEVVRFKDEAIHENPPHHILIDVASFQTYCRAVLKIEDLKLESLRRLREKEQLPG